MAHINYGMFMYESENVCGM